MSSSFWFNRIIEYWSLPDAKDVIDHVRRGKVQVVQVGNFGPDFYSLAEDDTVARSWVGMPHIGIQANLGHAADIVPQIQEAGARVVGQLSMTMHFGDHESGRGLFGDTWERIWAEDLLGQAPCSSVAEALQREEDGSLRQSHIEGRPYYTYRGCICNPFWLTALKSMVRTGLDIGLEGFNATHNYESLCRCRYCSDYMRKRFGEAGGLEAGELLALFGCQDPEEIEDPFVLPEDCSLELRARHEQILRKASANRRKEAFDEVFVRYGRSVRPDLLLAQWYHKYDLRVEDERCALSSTLWAKEEDYIWYSQGPYKWGSSIGQGYLADMGLPSRFMHAAGGGRPFVVNKYDYRRWRVWSAEAIAHGGAALAYHAGPPRPEQEDSTRIAPEDYYGPVIRYQRFMAEYDQLIRPTAPWSQVALVYPRRSEREGDAGCLDPLKRIGEWLEDGHVLFDIILDEQLSERAMGYETLILPDVQRLSSEETELLIRFVTGGGTLVLTGDTGTLDCEGRPHEHDPFGEWRTAPACGNIGSCHHGGTGHVFYVPTGPWIPERVPIRTLGDVEMPVYPRLQDDTFGQSVLAEVDRLSGGSALQTDAPWFVRVRAWQQEKARALVVHWINYLQDEEAAIETPIPVGPIEASCRVEKGNQLERVDWLYPEMREPLPLDFAVEDGSVRFSIPRLIVHGMSVIRFRRP